MITEPLNTFNLPPGCTQVDIEEQYPFEIDWERDVARAEMENDFRRENRD